ncbi:MAG: hypothetical protein K8F62_12470 [Pseudorhodoplanes sp.]|nr:hypothetical protein [Pseudorhodoplanes sp.]
MRDQYVGDVSDVLKFAFLRALNGDDRKPGVAWYYVPTDDGRPDGRHLEWRDEPEWKTLDTRLHSELWKLPDRSVEALERALFWPEGVLFHRAPVPSRAHRSDWAVSMRASLASANIVFLDPTTDWVTRVKSTRRFRKYLKCDNRAERSFSFPFRDATCRTKS